MKYEKIRAVTYRLLEDYEIQVLVFPSQNIKIDFLELSTCGILTIKKWYCWDGPSGPTVDTDTFVRGSLVHDALYELMRKGHLDKKHRKAADKLLRKLCKEGEKE
jgi:hypothetical protein